MELSDVFELTAKIKIYRDDFVKEYEKGTDEFVYMLAGWTEMCKGARSLPAFGVTVNDDLLESRKKGLWMEFCFGATFDVNGMQFEALLCEVLPNAESFNLNRFIPFSGYGGRCFNLCLNDKNMRMVYDIAMNI